ACHIHDASRDRVDAGHTMFVSIHLVLCLVFYPSDNSLQMSCHCICTIRSHTNKFSSPVWTNNIEECCDKVEHILTGMLIKHWNCNCVDIVKNSIEMEMNLIIEIGLTEVC